MGVCTRGTHPTRARSMAMNGTEARRMCAAVSANPRLVAQIVPSPMTLPFDAAMKRVVEQQIGRLLFVRVECIGNDFEPQVDASYEVCAGAWPRGRACVTTASCRCRGAAIGSSAATTS